MNYSTYRFSKNEWLREIATGTILSIGILYLFYQNFFIVIVFGIPFQYFYLKQRKKEKIQQRKKRLGQDFKECVVSLSTALSAGYSIENAFEETRKDMALYFNEESDIMIEVKSIVTKLQMNQNIEELLMDFAIRSDVEDIVSFTEVFVIAKRTGGNLIKILKRTADNLNQKMEVSREIETMVTAKKLESKIMSVIPMAMIGYLWLFSPGYLSPLYHNPFGILLMTVALALYFLAYCLMNKIMDFST